MNKRKLIIDNILSSKLPVGIGEEISSLSEEKADRFTVGNGLQMSTDRVLSAVGDGVYELIETIELEESVSEVVRTKEPNGTLYNFSAFMVTTKHPITTGATGMPMYVFPGMGEAGKASCGLPFTNNTDSQYATKTIFRLIGGYWDIYGYHGPATGASQMVGQTSAQNLVSKKEWPSISYLRIFVLGSVKFLPGMIIKIYGVRA